MRRRIRLAAWWLLAVGASLFAQEGRAVLDVGPIRAKGLHFLPLNVIEHYRGEYTIGEERLSVYYTSLLIEPFGSWSPFDCRLRSLVVVSSDEEQTVLYLNHDDDYSLFIEFSQVTSWACGFADAFVRRFLYFRQVGGLAGVPPFPAILDLQ